MIYVKFLFPCNVRCDKVHRFRGHETVYGRQRESPLRPGSIGISRRKAWIGSQAVYWVIQAAAREDKAESARHDVGAAQPHGSL